MASIGTPSPASTSRVGAKTETPTSVIAYDGRDYIADKSAWERARLPGLREEFSAAVLNQQIATCAVCKLEILFSTRTSAEFDEWAEALSGLRDVPITRGVCATALAGSSQEAFNFESRWIAPRGSVP